MEPQANQAESNSSDLTNIQSPKTIVTRSAFGGGLMGLANLVPGISGGTMLLAAGIYPDFINAIADVTKFRFKFSSLLVLATVVISAGIAILIGAGLLKDLVLNHRWIMYSLFIGLTLGGVPLVWRMAKPANSSVFIGAAIGFGAMAALAVLQAMNVVSPSQGSVAMSIVAGAAGASAMILPGLSGGYILLLLGQYVPILSAIDQFKDALKARDISAAMDPALTVLLPVGIGVIIGVVVVGNLVQWLFNKYRRATLGVLLGLLLGSTVGLWPFQVGVQPEVGQVIKGEAVTAENIAEVDPEDWPTEYFKPGFGLIMSSVVLIVAGCGATMAVSKIGGSNAGQSDSIESKF